jgi:hypothetical protein
MPLTEIISKEKEILLRVLLQYFPRMNRNTHFHTLTVIALVGLCTVFFNFGHYHVLQHSQSILTLARKTPLRHGATLYSSDGQSMTFCDGLWSCASAICNISNDGLKLGVSYKHVLASAANVCSAATVWLPEDDWLKAGWYTVTAFAMLFGFFWLYSMHHLTLPAIYTTIYIPTIPILMLLIQLIGTFILAVVTIRTIEVWLLPPLDSGFPDYVSVSMRTLVVNSAVSFGSGVIVFFYVVGSYLSPCGRSQNVETK